MALFSAPAYGTYPGANGKIAFAEASDHSIYVTTPATSRPTRLARGSRPDISGSGRRIVFVRAVRGAGAEIFKMKADGSRVIRLTRNHRLDSAPVFSPGGRRIAFHRTVGDHLVVFTMKADGTDVTRLGRGFEPDYSPDGRTIAFTRQLSVGTGVFLMNRGGSNIRPVTLDGSHPSFAPDGERIAFERTDESFPPSDCAECKGDQTEIVVTDTSGLDPNGAQDTTGLPSDGLAAGHSPSFSPNGRKIVFAYFDGAFQNLWVVNADGSGLRQLDMVIDPPFDPEPFDPDWGPRPGT